MIAGSHAACTTYELIRVARWLLSGMVVSLASVAWVAPLHSQRSSFTAARLDPHMLVQREEGYCSNLSKSYFDPRKES